MNSFAPNPRGGCRLGDLNEFFSCFLFGPSVLDGLYYSISISFSRVGFRRGICYMLDPLTITGWIEHIYIYINIMCLNLFGGRAANDFRPVQFEVRTLDVFSMCSVNPR